MQTASKSPFYGAFGLVTPSGVSPGVTAKDARWPRFAESEAGSSRNNPPAASAGAGLSKIQSVYQRMRLECGVGFHQLRTYRAIRRQRFPIHASITKTDGVGSLSFANRFLNQGGGHLDGRLVTGARSRA